MQHRLCTVYFTDPRYVPTEGGNAPQSSRQDYPTLILSLEAWWNERPRHSHLQNYISDSDDYRVAHIISMQLCLI